MTRLFDRIRTKGRRFVSMRLARRVKRMRNATPLISFTFDDFPHSALVHGGAILRAHGANGTFFASFGLIGKIGPSGEMFQWEDIRELLEHDHELGCHTYDHCHAWDTTSEEFEASIVRNREALRRHVPGMSFRSFSYPSSCPRPETKQRIAKYYDCCRGGGQTFNVGLVDLNFVKSCFLEQMPHVDVVSALIEANSRARGWLVLSTHDISERPSRFGCTPTFFEKVVRRATKSGSKIVTLCEGVKAIANPYPSYASSLGTSEPKRQHISSI
jgi:peptidoglycan/xylan/chitin deacetylase (PgdA/CDA1 family)